MGSNIKHNMDARIINLDALYSMADATVNLATLIIDPKEGKRIGGFTYKIFSAQGSPRSILVERIKSACSNTTDNVN
jgi:hypothetical protein